MRFQLEGNSPALNVDLEVVADADDLPDRTAGEGNDTLLLYDPLEAGLNSIGTEFGAFS